MYAGYSKNLQILYPANDQLTVTSKQPLCEKTTKLTALVNPLLWFTFYQVESDKNTRRFKIIHRKHIESTQQKTTYSHVFLHLRGSKYNICSSSPCCVSASEQFTRIIEGCLVPGISRSGVLIVVDASEDLGNFCPWSICTRMGISYWKRPSVTSCGIGKWKPYQSVVLAILLSILVRPVHRKNNKKRWVKGIPTGRKQSPAILKVESLRTLTLKV